MKYLLWFALLYGGFILGYTVALWAQFARRQSDEDERIEQAIRHVEV